MSIKYAPTVHLSTGRVRGIVQEVDEGEIYLYQGVPYGQAGRYEKPRPAAPWKGIYDATHPTVNPPQLNLKTPSEVYSTQVYFTTAYSEDCLLLNVWRPVEESSKPRAVMVYLYGGYFTTGSIFKVVHDARYVAKRGDVIVVMMNYRLGPLGFGYADDQMAPANLGHHDQIRALHWIQENITHFGGDKNNVTIFGNSAGSVSVGMLLLSPLTRGLFHRAIIQSGVPINFSRPKEELLGYSRQMAKKLGCKSDQIADIITFLKNRSIEEILTTSKELGDPFGPVFGDELMPQRPIDALKTGAFNADVDLLYGVVRDEGGAFAARKFPEIDDNEIGLTLKSTEEYCVTLLGKYGSDAFEYYRKRLNISVNSTTEELRELINRAYSDGMMIAQVILFGEYFVRHSPPHRRNYSWLLLQPAGLHIVARRSDYEWTDVRHADELYYLFTIYNQKSPKDKKLSQQMCYHWAQFAKSGDPGTLEGVKWEQAIDCKTPHTRVMALDYQPRMIEGYFAEIIEEFWKERVFGSE